MKLLHLYGDVMNLYGEYANVEILVRFLQDLGHEVSVDTLSLYESRDISGYDFYFMGAGTELRQKLVLPQLMNYRQPLKAAFEAGKVMLFTGNSFELLGRSVTDADGKVWEGLGLFDFETVESDRRIVGDCLAVSDCMDGLLVGFMNKCSKNTGIRQPLFTLRMGFGNEARNGGEGFREKNCFGTHLTGPILVKNPAMLRLLAGLLGAENTDSVSYPHMEKAYATTCEELKKRLEGQK